MTSEKPIYFKDIDDALDALKFKLMEIKQQQYESLISNGVDAKIVDDNFGVVNWDTSLCSDETINLKLFVNAIKKKFGKNFTDDIEIQIQQFICYNELSLRSNLLEIEDDDIVQSFEDYHNSDLAEEEEEEKESDDINEEPEEEPEDSDEKEAEKEAEEEAEDSDEKEAEEAEEEKHSFTTPFEIHTNYENRNIVLIKGDNQKELGEYFDDDMKKFLFFSKSKQWTISRNSGISGKHRISKLESIFKENDIPYNLIHPKSEEHFSKPLSSIKPTPKKNKFGNQEQDGLVFLQLKTSKTDKRPFIIGIQNTKSKEKNIKSVIPLDDESKEICQTKGWNKYILTSELLKESEEFENKSRVKILTSLII